MRRPGLFSRSSFRSPGRPVAVLFGLGCLLAPRLSAAHIMLAPPPATPIDWLKPNSQGDPQKITPCGVDATTALKTGANEVTIKVTNAWVNRLIGDEQPGATKITFADVKPYKANSPLLSSGLLGPVAVVRADSQ